MRAFYFERATIMKIKILASVIAALLSTTALADTSSLSTTTPGMGVLENDYVRAGVNGTTGTFGSGGNTSPGLLFDSTGTGTFNTSYDYLTPGSPFDGFSVMVDGTNYTNNNGGAPAQITNDGNRLTDGDGTLSWTGGVDSVFDITNTYSLGATTPYIDITSQITMDVGATILSFGRFIDPDARAAAGDSSVTDNVLGYGVIPDSNVAFSEALESRYALGLYSTDTNVDAGITMWTTAADSYTENMVDGDGSLTNTGDNTIGLSWTWTDVSAGDSLTASYAYIFGPSAFDAADDAITGGAGGGDTTTTDSWGTLEDVGSATDAAEGTAEPTLVSTSDPVASTTPSSYTDAEGDTLELGTSHVRADYSERTYVDTATTEFTRTNTYTTTAIETYSDSSTVEITGTTTGSETYLHIVTVEANDILASTTSGESTSVSQGIDEATVANAISDPTVTRDGFSENTRIVYTVTGEEVFEVTTPTVHTYNRTTTTTTEDDFADSSYYADTSIEATTTSTVSETYDVITEARVDREAGVNVDIKTDARQGDVVLDINRNITRGLTFGQVNVDRRTYDYGMYSGDSMLAQFGGTSVTDNGLAIGAGVLMSTTNFAGDTSNTAISSRTFGVTASREVNGWNLSSTIQHTESDVTKTENPSVTLSTFGSGIETSRITLPSVGSYTTEADAANSSLSFMAKGTGDTVRPIIGYTIGKEKIDNVTTQVIPGVLDIEHEGKSSNYSYASVGGEVSLGALSLTGIYHTDGVKDVAIGIRKETDSTSLYVSANKTITDLGDTNSIRAGITIKF